MTRRTKRRKSQKMHFQKFRDSCAQNRTSKYHTCTFIYVGLRLAEQNVGNLKKYQLCIGSEQSTCPSSQHSTCLASQQGRCAAASFGRPPFVVSFVLAVSTGYILVLRRKTCALLRAKADALALNKARVERLNTKICPVFTANTKEAAFSRLHKGAVIPKRTLACCGHHQHQPKVMERCSKTDFGMLR